MVLKIRDGGSVQRRALYLALGVTLDGDRDVLGMWFQEPEGVKVLDAGPDRLRAARRTRHPDLLRRRPHRLPRRDRSDFPRITVQLCIVHYGNSGVMPPCGEKVRKSLDDLVDRFA